MRSLRRLVLTLVALPLVAAGCGGGPSGDPGAGALVTGKVVSRDGSTASLAGVEVQALGAGPGVVTDALGRFRFDLAAGTPWRIRFHDPLANAPALPGDVREGLDDTPDGRDLDGDEVEIGPFADGETCDVEVEIEGGEVVECWIRRHERGEEGGECPMEPPPGWDGPPARGEVEVACDETCCRIEIEVEGLEAADVLEVVLVGERGGEESLGTLVAGTDGAGHFVWEACEGDGLPLGASSLEELAGAVVLLVDEQGQVLLVGQVPGGGPQHDDGDHCHGVEPLLPPGGEPGEAFGVALVKVIEGCSFLVVEVAGLGRTGTFSVALAETPDGSEATLGTFEVGEHGIGRFFLETCSASDVPFGASTLADLAGAALRVKGPDGGVLLAGTLPAPDEGACGDEPPPPLPEEKVALFPPERSPEPWASGVILLKYEERCLRTVIEVGGLSRAQTLHVLFVIETESIELGTLTVGEAGTGRLVLEPCGEDGVVESLGLELPNPEPLAFYRLVDGEGRAVLESERVPYLPMPMPMPMPGSPPPVR